jgi:hypothetical protein
LDLGIGSVGLRLGGLPGAEDAQEVPAGVEDVQEVLAEDLRRHVVKVAPGRIDRLAELVDQLVQEPQLPLSAPHVRVEDARHGRHIGQVDDRYWLGGDELADREELAVISASDLGERSLDVVGAIEQRDAGRAHP